MGKIDGESITSLFNLSKAQLWPLVEQFAHEDLKDFTIPLIQRPKGHYGYSAEKMTPTFFYTTQTGRTGQKTVFVKRFYTSDMREGENYYYLSKRGIPLPQLYGVLYGKKQEEILFLEYLEYIGIERSNENEFHTFLTTLARFNTVEITNYYATILPHHRLGLRLIDEKRMATVLDCIKSHAMQNGLGEEIAQLFQQKGEQLSRIIAFGEHIGRQVIGMPCGLLHYDFTEQNTGWRVGKQDFVIFDLHQVGIGPRFWDIAVALNYRNIQPSGAFSYDKWAHKYLDEWKRCSGYIISFEVFLQETGTLWWARQIDWLEWQLCRSLDGQADWTENREVCRQIYQARLHRALNRLLNKITEA